MDEKTSLLISMGAATAANCVPCFEHYYQKAHAAGLTSADIQEAVDIATKVKGGAHLVIKNSIRSLMGHETPVNPCAGSSPKRSCCA